MLLTISSARHLDDLGSQAQQLHPALLPQLSRDDTEDASTQRLTLLVQEHTGVIIKTNIATIGTEGLLAGADHKRMTDITLLDLGHTRCRCYGVCLGLVHNHHNLIAYFT